MFSKMAFLQFWVLRFLVDGVEWLCGGPTGPQRVGWRFRWFCSRLGVFVCLRYCVAIFDIFGRLLVLRNVIAAIWHFATPIPDKCPPEDTRPSGTPFGDVRGRTGAGTGKRKRKGRRGKKKENRTPRLHNTLREPEKSESGVLEG